MSKAKSRKHNIDIMFLMVLFLVFTFSAVSVLLMAVNSYKSVVHANEENANARTAIAYVREKVRQHDSASAVGLTVLDGCDAIKLSEENDTALYIYWYEGYLMELTVKEGASVTADFGNKIMEISEMEISCENNQLIRINVEDSSGNSEHVLIGVKSGGGL